MSILVTGGAGFIGSNFILNFLQNNDEQLINIDKLSYAGNLNNLYEIATDERYRFFHNDIKDHQSILKILSDYQPRAIINFAAESHVDNSINRPYNFVSNNVLGVLSLLNTSLEYYQSLDDEKKTNFRFIQISTDEVYGSLNPKDNSFTELNQYAPNSPYAASKASCDHLVRAWYKTYGLPVITSNCSNNYGPRQFPEKLIPVVISTALSGSEIPLYGDGENIRDWLYVDDHCEALSLLLESGTPGESYNIGGNNELTNKQVVISICRLLDKLIPLRDNKSYCEQIRHVEDRRGHDRRYSINSSKIQHELGWQATLDFHAGLAKTVEWYLEHAQWLKKSLQSNIHHLEISQTADVKKSIDSMVASSGI